MFHLGTMQDPQELAWFKDIIRGKGSMLEIGSGTGGNLYECARALRPGAILRSITLGQFDMGRFNAAGDNCEYFIGRSQDDDAWTWAAKWALYDVIFIDGDHSYKGCMSDWEMYHPLSAGIVAFHDIAGSRQEPDGEPDCKEVWQEVRARAQAQGWETKEFIASPQWMGIGVVFIP